MRFYGIFVVPKISSQAWHSLPKEEQERYFDMAKQARDDHAKAYPNWSARDNYAINKKKRKKRERSLGKFYLTHLNIVFE